MVDTDKYPIPVHFPFLLKKNFEGLIKQGTPIIQVIPFKRESWKSSYSFLKQNEHLYRHDKTIGKNLINNYIYFF